MGIVSGIRLFVRALISDRAAIGGENLALRQRLGVLRPSAERLTLRRHDPIRFRRAGQAGARVVAIMVGMIQPTELPSAEPTATSTH
jgi:hypothetical protein